MIDVADESAVVAGENQFLFLDKGQDDGLLPGHLLYAHLHDDFSQNTDSENPEESIGTLLVVQTQEHMSTCLVLNSMREITPGDFARTIVPEMATGNTKAPVP